MPLQKQILQEPETVLVGPKGETTVGEARTDFECLRSVDDEFAREYRRGEFLNWLNDEGYKTLTDD